MNNSSLGTSFDFNSQAGVAKVLAAIRNSNIKPVEKNELRDLVFLYTNSGGDLSVKNNLEQKLANFQITLDLASISESVVQTGKTEEVKVAVATLVPQFEPVPVSPFGNARLAPVFDKPQTAAADVNVAGNPEVATVLPSAIPAVPIVDDVKQPTPPLLVNIPATVHFAPAPAPAPVAVAPAPVAVEKPLDVPAAVNQTIPTKPFPDVEVRHLDRIREIKSAVNSQVGNPVNLVDINNTVGREYMNALLDAMKRLSGGAGQIEPAMQRLEAAYIAVEKVMTEHELSKLAVTPIAEPSVETVPVVPIASVTPSAAIVEPVAIPLSIPSPQVEKFEDSVPEVAAPVFEPLPVLEDVVFQPNPEPTPAPVPTPTFAPITPIAVVVPEPVVVAPAVAVVSEPLPTPVVQQFAPVAAPIANPVVPEPQTPHTVAPSVLEGARIRTPDELPEEGTQKDASVDPLFSHEINNGLEQLLSDWVLFKKSGLFGTGPKGQEHPLYKKISNLPIPHLLTGRFEGSNQEIKQSITDYMNGWRYEQGIIYEQGETFEHYLRRVIKQILDLQKKRRTA